MTTPPVPTTPAPSRRRDDPRMHTVEMAAISAEEVEADLVRILPPSAPLRLRHVAVLVVAGGALGSALRFVLDLILPVTLTPTIVSIPWSTALANLLGCLVAGAVTGLIATHPRAPLWVEPFLVTGVCGAFTTMSVLTLQVTAMVGADFPLMALLYGIGTAVSALAAAVLGHLLGTVLGRRLCADSQHADAQHADPLSAGAEGDAIEEAR